MLRTIIPFFDKALMHLKDACACARVWVHVCAQLCACVPVNKL